MKALKIAVICGDVLGLTLVLNVRRIASTPIRPSVAFVAHS